MTLIGMLSSPYLRRVAISLSELGVDFEHARVSVFADFDVFRSMNPVVRAPTLILDDGTLLMDSNVIIEHFERAALPGSSLWPRDEPSRTRCAQTLGLALSACDKAVQLVYERELRPVEKQYGDWAQRVTRQVTAACQLLEEKFNRVDLWLASDRLTQAGLTLAVVFTFIRHRVADTLADARLPNLHAFCDEAEALAVFRRWPHSNPHAPLAVAPLSP